VKNEEETGEYLQVDGELRGRGIEDDSGAMRGKTESVSFSLFFYLNLR